jgi:hypothetical protein
MRAMYKPAVLVATVVLASCSTSDTVVALNVSLKAPPAGLATLRVTITQAGQSPLTTAISPPTVPIDGGVKFKDEFFERIALPESWTSGAASIHVEAQSSAGGMLASRDAEVELRDEGAVAAQIRFEAAVVPKLDAGVAGEDAGE